MFRFISDGSISIIIVSDITTVASLRSLGSRLSTTGVNTRTQIRSQLLEELIPGLSMGNILLVTVGRVQSGMKKCNTSAVAPKKET